MLIGYSFLLEHPLPIRIRCGFLFFLMIEYHKGVKTSIVFAKKNA